MYVPERYCRGALEWEPEGARTLARELTQWSKLEVQWEMGSEKHLETGKISIWRVTKFAISQDGLWNLTVWRKSA